MIIFAYAFLILLALIMQALYTGSEMGLYTVNRFRLRKRQSAGERSARVLAFLLHDPVGLLVTFLLGTNIAVYFVTAVVTSIYEDIGLTPENDPAIPAEVAATITLTLPLFLTEVITKNFVRRYTERLSYYLAWGLFATRYVLLPLVLVFKPLAALAAGKTKGGSGMGLPRLSKNILHHLLTAGREAGELTVEQERLARNVLRVGNHVVARLVREIAWGKAVHDHQGDDPLVRTLAVSAAEGVGFVLKKMSETRSRLALVMAPTADRNGDGLLSSDILGYVRLFDLLEPGAQNKAVGSLARPVPRLADHATLRGSLTVMQRECADVAIVEVSPTSPARASSKRGGAVSQRSTPPDLVDRPVLGVVRIAQLISELLGAPPPAEGGNGK